MELLHILSDESCHDYSLIDECGTDSDQGYFLFFKNDSLYNVITISCGRSGLSIANKSEFYSTISLKNECTQWMINLINDVKNISN
ncbi:hypothetical protein K6119_03615 [Paracrocinitomix mangrovi]|uniref:hypothetical protein n=1 Tax=Paracrocinitomix mangrovi TaxID=2862509 RepID=UPI001C8D493F|nr:hypothetical protein [Paracrocinitomix mangrovi]UKN02599.1 hypothetical protein K6119_03615 [Paracrocinitomix mangrovi]